MEAREALQLVSDTIGDLWTENASRVAMETPSGPRRTRGLVPGPS